MEQGIKRRDLLARGGATVAGLAMLGTSSFARAFPVRPGEEVIAWLDQPPPRPARAAADHLLRWEEVNSWITPNDKFFDVAHYNQPAIDEETWALKITGLVQHPLTLTLNEIRARPRREIAFTLECSGNNGHPWFIGGIGTARWGGTPLAAILDEARVMDGGIEVVFWGGDAGEEEVRHIKMPQHFARSMSLADARSPDNLLCYEMNGQVLPRRHGFPLRLIAPGWYGIANVKWLTHIEVRNTRFMNRFMARDYVTIRKEQYDGRTEWVESSVGRALIKSAPAKVARQGGRYRIIGAAWGAPIARVEVKIDNGPWQPAPLDRGEEAEFAWKIWSVDWPDPPPGEHSITSRAFDTAGHRQPASDDPAIANKQTYWESNGQITRHIRI